jgi:hypothetical protein
MLGFHWSWLGLGEGKRKRMWKRQIVWETLRREVVGERTLRDGGRSWENIALNFDIGRESKRTYQIVFGDLFSVCFFFFFDQNVGRVHHRFFSMKPSSSHTQCFKNGE